MGTLNEKPMVNKLEKEQKRWFKDWKKLCEAIYPTEEDGPFCRDCADSDGRCPTDNLPCDPTDRRVEIVNSLRQENQRLKQQVAEGTAVLLDSIDKPTYLKALEENQRLTKERDDLKEAFELFKRGIVKGSELYARLKFDDAEFTPYQLAIQENQRLREALALRDKFLNDNLEELWQKVKHCYDQSCKAAAHQEFLSEDRQLMYEIREMQQALQNTKGENGETTV